MCSGDVRDELLDHPIAPRGRLDLAADVLADLPVQVYQFVVDGRDRPRPRRVDQGDDLVELAPGRSRRRLRTPEERAGVLLRLLFLSCHVRSSLGGR